jgi:hypothetical protein
MSTLSQIWKGGNSQNSHYTLCALLSRMNELMVERPTLYGGGHIVSEVSANVTVLCVFGLCGGVIDY